MQVRIPINSPKLGMLQIKADHSLFTLLNLHPRAKDDKERLAKERTAIWAKAEILVKLHPSSFRRKYKFKSWNSEVHPLGMLFVLKAPEDLIKTAYEVFPEAAKDAFSVACSYDVDFELIKWLYNEAPKVLTWETRRNNLPLHVVMGRKPSCLSTVKFLYR